jgi:ribosomal protein S18 acetylase RimI-like enzyme
VTEIRIGVPAAGRATAARLYREAFAAKLRPALGTGHRCVAALARALDDERIVCAVRDGEVLGVLGFHHAGRSAFGLRHRDLAAIYPRWSAGARLLLLAPLDRRARPGELLLDGVCVAAAARGLGIGTALLGAAAEVARSVGAAAVRLSVVDTNPRARALYERLGFRPTRTVHLGALSGWYGFASATEMVRAVAPAEAAA